MAICTRCGEEYKKDEVSLLHADVSRVPVDICEQCLEDAYYSGEEGLFYDTCEECGKDFDVMDEKTRYMEFIRGDEGVTFEDFDKILCADCAIEELAKMFRDDEDELQ